MRVFGLNGQHLRTFGRDGEGPGEFGDITSLAWVRDRLLALDLVGGRITEFSAAGKPLGQRKAPGRWGGSVALRLYHVAADEAYSVGATTDATGLSMVFVGQTSRGETGDTLHPREDPWDQSIGWVNGPPTPLFRWLLTSLSAGQVTGEELLAMYRQRGKAEGHIGELMSVVNPALSSSPRPKRHYRRRPVEHPGPEGVASVCSEPGIRWPYRRTEARNPCGTPSWRPILGSGDPVFRPGEPDRPESSPAMGLGE